MKKMFVCCLLIICTAACAPDSGSTAITSVPMEYVGLSNPYGAEAAEEGAAVYRMYCENCHGPRGYGDGVSGATLNPPPSNLATLKDTVGDDYLFWRISAGRPGTAMVAWKGILTEEQIWKTISFLRTLK